MGVRASRAMRSVSLNAASARGSIKAQRTNQIMAGLTVENRNGREGVMLSPY
jgi:hypothetical protein